MAAPRLKEQDDLIKLVRSFILDNHDGLLSLTVDEAFETVQSLVEDHVRVSIAAHSSEGERDDAPHDGAGAGARVQRKEPQSKLRRYAPKVHRMFVPLDLMRALKEYDSRTKITKRRFVPPTFKEIRHIFNIATVHAAAPRLKMVTLDADDTIYSDGGTLRRDSPIVDIVVRLMHAGVIVSLVTAAGYPGRPERYEERLDGLLQSFNLAMTMGADGRFFERFLVMGGECNYLYYVNVVDSKCHLAELPGALWKDGRGVRWHQEDIKELLDTAERTLTDTSKSLGLDIKILRKDRAVGMIRMQKSRFAYEVLEEVAFAVQEALKDLRVPHCAFNGGNDVWVDIGNKALGIRALQSLVGAMPWETIHVGDRFTRTGNDTRARQVSNSLWVCNPKETMFVMRLLLADLHDERHNRQAYMKPSPLRGVISSASAAPRMDAGTPSRTTPISKPTDERSAAGAGGTAPPLSLGAIDFGGGTSPTAGIGAPAAAASAAVEGMGTGAGAGTVSAGVGAAAAGEGSAPGLVVPKPRVKRHSSKAGTRRHPRRHPSKPEGAMELGSIGMDIGSHVTMADREVDAILRSPVRPTGSAGNLTKLVRSASQSSGGGPKGPASVDGAAGEHEADLKTLEDAFVSMTSEGIDSGSDYS